MADIQNMHLFNTTPSKKTKLPLDDKPPKAIEEKENKLEEIYNSPVFNEYYHKRRNVVKLSSKIGRPLEHYDKVFKATQSFKTTPLINALVRSCTDFLLPGKTKNEVLLLAMLDFLNNHYSKEDREAIFEMVIKELDLFRVHYPASPILDDYSNIIKSVEDVEKDTSDLIRRSLGLD